MRLQFLCIATAMTMCAAAAQNRAPFLLQHPTMNKTHIVFSYAGDLWKVTREGGEAARLTTGVGIETDPHFSPDGSMVAFTGEYDGNVDVYVVPASGGVPRRLTWHPASDRVVGWTPDGKILFQSGRLSFSRYQKLFTVSMNGGMPTELPLPMAVEGSLSADGSQIAYVPFSTGRSLNTYAAWKRYRGGLASPIWIAKLADSSMEKLPREKSNDFSPMWIGNKIYFLSDRNGPVTLFAYDTAKKSVTELVKSSGYDIKSAAAGPGGIVYDQFGTLFVYDTGSGKTREVDVQINGDLPEVRTRLQNVARELKHASLSPNGIRAAMEAHGEILTIPADKGDVRNLTNTTGVMERYPAWSPNGKEIAYFSDESGEYMLHVKAQNGFGDVKKFQPGAGTAFYFEPKWSPDGKKVAYTDNRLNVWYLDLASGKANKVDTDTYYDPENFLDPAWSPDSKWIAYTRQLKNHLRAVFFYSVETGKSTQVTDGMSDARFAQFDRDGKYLYFTASTNAGLQSGWLDMSSDPHHVTSSVYLIVLAKDTPSPLAPESDEEKAAEEKPKADEKKADKAPAAVKIDFDQIMQRILALPMPPRNYAGLYAGKSGVLYVTEGGTTEGPVASRTLHKYDLKARKSDKIADGIGSFALSANGEKMLFRQQQRWFIAGTAQPLKPGEGALKTELVEVRVDPKTEWKQMYNEVWRIERDYFYDPNYHGLNLADASKKYEPYLQNLGSRADLNYLFDEMLGEITVGHLYIRGGISPQVKPVAVGLLGADYEIANGRFRFRKVYNGENWNPTQRAPLTQPGVNVNAGEYLLAVNGREVRDSDEVYSFFEGTAGKSVILRVGPNPSMNGSREVTVVPLESETALRNLDWVESNRRKVDQMTNGRVAYVYMPDTGSGGFTSFNRYFFSQVEKEGVVIDERFNGGGQAADYVIDVLRRPLLSYWTTRYGETGRTPVGGIFGPKAMIINEFAGSGGDAMPWYFRKVGLGPLVGKRTWGGLVGILGFPELMDGGSVTAPNLAFYTPSGQWDVENHGVEPTVEVELDPKLVREGHDPQLERAVAMVMDGLKKSPVPVTQRPAYPNYHKREQAKKSD